MVSQPFPSFPLAVLMRSDRLLNDLRIVAGAELDAIDEDGRTALWLASRHSRLGATRQSLKSANMTEMVVS